MIDNWRWAGVPFYLRTGKALARAPHRDRDPLQAGALRAVPRHAGRAARRQRLVLQIQPDEGIALQLQRQGAGAERRAGRRRDGFQLRRLFQDAAPSTGYETLLYDCMIGDATLFQRADNIEAGWRVVQPFARRLGGDKAGRCRSIPRAARGPPRPTRSCGATGGAGGRSPAHERAAAGVGLMASVSERPAPGWPGIPARWTSSAKSGVGTALSPQSRVWFTLSHGILNEIYYPRVDQACTRDFGLIVTDGRDFSPRRSATRTARCAGSTTACPAFQLANTALDGRFRIDKTVLVRPAAATWCCSASRFAPLAGRARRLSPLRAAGAASGQSRRRQHRLARRLQGRADAVRRRRRHRAGARLLGARGSRARSGFVGASDGWQDLHAHYALTWTVRPARGRQRRADRRDRPRGLRRRIRAGARLRPPPGRGGATAPAQPATTASTRRSADYVAGWRAWQDGLLPLDPPRPATAPTPIASAPPCCAATRRARFPAA